MLSKLVFASLRNPSSLHSLEHAFYRTTRLSSSAVVPLLSGSAVRVRNSPLFLQRRNLRGDKERDDELVLPSMVNKDFPLKKEVEKMVEEETKNWVSMGYSLVDRDHDVMTWNAACFALCTVFTWLLFYWYYLPSPRLNDWARREAYLRLEEREAHGLPAIDPNYIDPARVELPADEELGDFEVII